MSMRAGWRFAYLESGVLCVMISGAARMLRWCAISWASTTVVRVCLYMFVLTVWNFFLDTCNGEIQAIVASAVNSPVRSLHLFQMI